MPEIDQHTLYSVIAAACAFGCVLAVALAIVAAGRSACDECRRNAELDQSSVRCSGCAAGISQNDD